MYRREILSNPTKWWDSLTSDQRLALVKNLKIDFRLRQQRKKKINYSAGLDEIFETYCQQSKIKNARLKIKVNRLNMKPSTADQIPAPYMQKDKLGAPRLRTFSH